MEIAHDLVESIKQRIHDLKAKYENLKAENQELTKYNNELEELIINQKSEINRLTELQKNNNQEQIPGTDQKSRDTEKRIDEIVREIDECINLLNR